MRLKERFEGMDAGDLFLFVLLICGLVMLVCLTIIVGCATYVVVRDTLTSTPPTSQLEKK